MKKSRNFIFYAGIILFLSMSSCSKNDLKGPIPTVRTIGLHEITANSAFVEAEIISYEDSTISQYGICWSENEDVSIDDSKTTYLKWNGTGKFTHRIGGLLPEKTYYARAYATNKYGTGYGEIVSFTTQEGVVDIDGNGYNIVTIGSQVWMAENLKTTKFNDGQEIPYLEFAAWKLDPGYVSYVWYERDIENKTPYGALYNWNTVNTGKLCPVGWHIPSYDEWMTLVDYLGGVEKAGGSLKEQGTEHWVSPNTGATNESGFNGLPAGYHNTSGASQYLGKFTFFWSTKGDEINGNKIAWCLQLNFLDENAIMTGYIREMGVSVRCIKD